jgi:hypothetical protein
MRPGVSRGDIRVSRIELVAYEVVVTNGIIFGVRPEPDTNPVTQ